MTQKEYSKRRKEMIKRHNEDMKQMKLIRGFMDDNKDELSPQVIEGCIGLILQIVKNSNPAPPPPVFIDFARAGLQITEISKFILPSRN